MLCSKLLEAHVPHPNNLVYFNQLGIVTTLFVARVCFLQTFLYSFDSATDSSGGAWLAHANSAYTRFYNRIVLLFSVFFTYICFDTQRPKRPSMCLTLIIWSIFTS